MALVIAGERSGVGKTTVTLALLTALRQWGRVQSFKVGPDYIDPMFHSYVTGRACRNLDPVLTSEAYVRQCFQQHAQGIDYAIVEGVMGLFDGATGTDDWGSTAQIARLLELPILLVLDCSRLARSIAALVHGYTSLDPRLRFAGLVLNRVGSDRHLELLTTALKPFHLPILGVLRRQDAITLPDRHLGLVPTAELPELDRVLDRLTQVGETCFDWDALRPLVPAPPAEPIASTPCSAPFLTAVAPHSPPPRQPSDPVRLAVAHDRAFSFYYPDNLDLLEQLGAELVTWSPLADDDLPAGVQGLYFGGGFPEVFAAQLQANHLARLAVKRAIETGMPTYAECGGLMYLAEQIVDFEGQSWQMVGILPTVAQMGTRLTLGYRRAELQQASPIAAPGTILWGHEFHRSHLTTTATPPLYHLRGYQATPPDTPEGWRCYQIHASYVHLHWGANPELPAQFLQTCRQFAQPTLETMDGRNSDSREHSSRLISSNFW